MKGPTHFRQFVISKIRAQHAIICITTNYAYKIVGIWYLPKKPSFSSTIKFYNNKILVKLAFFGVKRAHQIRLQWVMTNDVSNPICVYKGAVLCILSRDGRIYRMSSTSSTTEDWWKRTVGESMYNRAVCRTLLRRFK